MHTGREKQVPPLRYGMEMKRAAEWKSERRDRSRAAD